MLLDVDVINVVVFELGSKYPFIGDLNTDINGLKLKGCVVRFIEETCHSKLHELSSIDMVLMDDNVSI